MMWLIVDANRGSALVNPNPASRPVVEWLDRRGGVLAVGGKLLEELTTNKALKKKLVVYTRAGICRIYPKDKIEGQYAYIDEAHVQSDDIHVLGLARVSGCRLLYTNDHALSQDFRNRRLVPPRDGHTGRIYRDERDRKKLYDCPACR
jgi:hypothetical protein